MEIGMVASERDRSGGPRALLEVLCWKGGRSAAETEGEVRHDLEDICPHAVTVPLCLMVMDGWMTRVPACWPTLRAFSWRS